MIFLYVLVYIEYIKSTWVTVKYIKSFFIKSSILLYRSWYFICLIEKMVMDYKRNLLGKIKMLSRL